MSSQEVLYEEESNSVVSKTGGISTRGVQPPLGAPMEGITARHLARPRAVWADAICINQEDDREKGDQVGLMGPIYSKASCTLICLGFNEQSWVHDIMALIKYVDEMIFRVFSNPENVKSWDIFPYPQPQDPLLSNERWQSWNILLKQPWFARGWVVQEVALSIEASLLLDDQEIPWLSLLGVNRWLDSRSVDLIGINRGTDVGIDCILCKLQSRIYALRWPEEAIAFYPRPERGQISSYMSMTTLEVLDYARSLQLKNPKDRIYAFMTYPYSEATMPALQPRYGSDTSFLDVYREFATKYLENTRDLDLLRFFEHEDDELALAVDSDSFLEHLPVRSLSFPSWIPRWDRGGRGYLLGMTHHRKIDECSQQMTLLRNDSILQVKGVIFDSVRHISDEIRETSHLGAAVTSVVSLWRDVAEQSIQYPGPHQNRLGMAFLQTLGRASYTGDLATWKTALKTFADQLQSDSSDLPVDTYSQHSNAQMIVSHVLNYSKTRRFLVSSRGYFGVSSVATRQGDVCAIIFGTRSVFILRELDKKRHHFAVIGAAYVPSPKLGDSGLPLRIGHDNDCTDWKNWNLPIRDISLC